MGRFCHFGGLCVLGGEFGSRVILTICTCEVSRSTVGPTLAGYGSMDAGIFRLQKLRISISYLHNNKYCRMAETWHLLLDS